MPLTDTMLKNARPEAKSRKLFDDRGLYLEITPAGGKWWRLKYYHQRKEKRISLGVYPDVGLREARARRDEARRLVAEGVDPSAHRQSRKRHAEERSANTFEAITREWFEGRKKNWAESHSSRVIALFEREIFDEIGKVPITDIDAPTLLRVLKRIEAGTADTAHRARTNCGMVFAYAISTGRATRNVAADLRGALAPVKKSHFAATLDPKRLGEILRLMNSYSGTPAVCNAMKLAPLVFVRPGELRSAEWAQIDLDRAEWNLISSKTKMPLVVPLSRQAVAILRAMHEVSGQGQYVFPGGRSAKKPLSDNAVLAGMRRLKIGKQEMTGHGFRAVARTILDETLGFRDDFVEHQLAHAVKGPLGRAYNRTSHLAERKKMMQAWADHLDTLKSRGAADATEGK